MITKNITTVDFDDIFRFAEKEFGIKWNAANDLFFDSVLTYKGYNKFAFKNFNVEVRKSGFEDDSEKAEEIIYAFAKANNIKGTFLVLNN